MKKILFLSILLFLLIQNFYTKQLNCLTGHKILTRKKITDSKTKQITYKFQHKCLCPNNYYGKQCQNHINIDCYLSNTDDGKDQHKQMTVINQTNIEQEMNFQMDFFMDCWVGQRNRFKSKLKLVDYLQQYNAKNAYGVREQFGDGVDIIWANTTQNIFDKQGEFKIISDMREQNKSYQLTEQQKLKILIGNNTELYNNPFTYESEFLGYGLINGKVSYELRVFDPEKGMIGLKDFTSEDVKVILSETKADYSPSRRVSEKIKQKKTNDNLQDDGSKAIQKDNESKIPLPDIDSSSLKEYTDQYNKISDFFNSKTTSSSTNQYHLKLPIKINPYNATFYSTIKLSLIISENYQQIISHQISLNSFDMTIFVNVQNVGYQPTLHKNLIIASQSYKTYYKILFVVGIILVVYFALTLGYKKWKSHKEKALQKSQYSISLEQQVMKTSTK